MQYFPGQIVSGNRFLPKLIFLRHFSCLIKLKHKTSFTFTDFRNQWWNLGRVSGISFQVSFCVSVWLHNLSRILFVICEWPFREERRDLRTIAHPNLVRLINIEDNEFRCQFQKNNAQVYHAIGPLKNIIQEGNIDSTPKKLMNMKFSNWY